MSLLTPRQISHSLPNFQHPSSMASSAHPESIQSYPGRFLPHPYFDTCEDELSVSTKENVPLRNENPMYESQLCTETDTCEDELSVSTNEDVPLKNENLLYDSQLHAENWDITKSRIPILGETHPTVYTDGQVEGKSKAFANVSNLIIRIRNLEEREAKVTHRELELDQREKHLAEVTEKLGEEVQVIVERVLFPEGQLDVQNENQAKPPTNDICEKDDNQTTHQSDPPDENKVQERPKPTLLVYASDQEKYPRPRFTGL